MFQYPCKKPVANTAKKDRAVPLYFAHSFQLGRGPFTNFRVLRQVKTHGMLYKTSLLTVETNQQKVDVLVSVHRC